MQIVTSFWPHMVSLKKQSSKMIWLLTEFEFQNTFQKIFLKSSDSDI